MAQNAFDGGGRRLPSSTSGLAKRARVNKFGGPLVGQQEADAAWRDQLKTATAKLKGIQQPAAPKVPKARLSMQATARKQTNQFVPTVRLDASQITDRRRIR